MWIGTAKRAILYWKKATDKYQYIPMPVESSYIYSLYQAPKRVAVYRDEQLRPAHL